MEQSEAELVLRALEKRKVEYAIFGGFALNLHGITRFTEDIDLFIRPSQENIEKLRDALSDAYSDPEIESIRSEDLLGEYPAIQYLPPNAALHLDLVTRLGESFKYEDLEIQRCPFAGFEISVVSPETLFEMKKDTVRLRDRADAEMLREKFGWNR